MAELELALEELVQLSYFNKGETKVQRRGGTLDYFPQFVTPCTCNFAKLPTVSREYFLPPLILLLAM